MYNRNYGGFDYVRIHSELLKSVLNRKLLTLIPQLTVIRDRCKTFELSIEKTISNKILSGIGILMSGFFSIIGLSEFYKIGIKKETESYPFGGEGPVPYYYKTAQLYSNVNLTYGIAFGLLLGIAIWNWKKNKKNGFLIFGITCLLILIQILQG